MTKALIYSLLFLLTVTAALANELQQGVDVDKLHTVAQSGDSRAQYWLGAALMIREQCSDIVSRKECRDAFEWIKKAANRHYPLSEIAMGGIYSTGVYIKPNKTEAFKWYALAEADGGLNTDLGVDAARKKVALSKQMTASEISQAIKEVKKMIPSYDPAYERSQETVAEQTDLEKRLEQTNREQGVIAHEEERRRDNRINNQLQQVQDQNSQLLRQQQQMDYDIWQLQGRINQNYK